MAEVGTIAAALQLAELALKLKQLCSNIKNAPSELRDLLEEVAVLADLLADVPQTSQNLPVQSQRAWERCHKLFESSVVAMRQVTCELDGLLRSHKTTGAVRIYLKKDHLRRCKEKLERVKTTMLLAQQAYSSAILTQQNESLLQEIRAVAVWQQRQSDMEQASSVAVRAVGDISGEVELPSRIIASTPTRAARHPRKSRSKLSYFLRMPLWIFRKGIHVLVDPGQGSWGITFRCYNLVSDDSEVFKAASNDDWIRVSMLFNSGDASPFDMCAGRGTLLQCAVDNANSDAYRMLTGHGLNPTSLPERGAIGNWLCFDDGSPHSEIAYGIACQNSLMLLAWSVKFDELGHPKISSTMDLFSMILSHPDAEFDLADCPAVPALDHHSLRLLLEVARPYWSAIDRCWWSDLVFNSVVTWQPASFIPLILGPDKSLAQAMKEAGQYGGLLITNSQRLAVLSMSAELDATETHRWKAVLKDIVDFESRYPGTTDASDSTPLHVFLNSYANFALCHSADLFEVHWNEFFTRVARLWLQHLREAGADLMRYGRAEKIWALDGIEIRFTSSNESTILKHGGSRFKEFVFRITHIVYGPEVDDWCVYVKPCGGIRWLSNKHDNNIHVIEYPFEYEIAGEFWESVENPERFSMPGAYVYTKDELDDAYASHWYIPNDTSYTDPII